MRRRIPQERWDYKALTRLKATPEDTTKRTIEFEEEEQGEEKDELEEENPTEEEEEEEKNWHIKLRHGDMKRY